MTLVFVLLGVAWVLLPIVSVIRTIRLQAEVDRLRQRLQALEGQMAARPFARPSSDTGAPAPTEMPPVRPRPVAPSPEPDAAAAAPVDRAVRPLEPAPALASTPAGPAAIDLEERIGGRWLQHAGLIVLVLGVAFFLRYAFEHEWLSPAVRVALGAVAGVGMGAAGLRLARRYRAYGLLLSGGGAAVLYLSIYAGLNRYFLFGPEVAFTLLVAITAAAAWVADRADSQTLGLMAVCGGFATPFLVVGGSDQQLTLFSYAALLVAATMYLAHRRNWPWLNVASLALTALTVLAWADRFYTPAKYLRTELFLTLYCAMFVAMLRRTWRAAHDTSAVAGLLLLAPAAYHVSSVVMLYPHGLAFLIYLIGITCVAVLAGVHFGSSLLRMIAWVAVALPLGNWIETHGARGWIVATVTTVAVVYVVHLAAQVRLVLDGDELEERDVALLHANGIGVYAALYRVLTNTLSFAELSGVAVLLGAGNLALWAALRRGAPVRALHWFGVAMTLVAVAVWVQLGGPWAVVAWASEGAVVFWIAARAEPQWLRAGAWVLMGLALFRWLQPDIQETATSFVVLANARALTGLFLVAVLYLAAWIGRRYGGRTEERATLLVAANVQTVIVISTEIASFWALRPTVVDAGVAREMMLSASWVLYAAVVVVIGMRLRYAPIRYFAIALFGISLLKVFFVDLMTLGGIYRVVGFLVVGLILVVVSFLYQRANLPVSPPRAS